MWHPCTWINHIAYHEKRKGFHPLFLVLWQKSCGFHFHHLASHAFFRNKLNSISLNQFENCIVYQLVISHSRSMFCEFFSKAIFASPCKSNQIKYNMYIYSYFAKLSINLSIQYIIASLISKLN